MGLIDGQVAIVTGGAGEIARGVARRFAREGARVVIVDRNEACARQAASGIDGAEGRAADMTDAASAQPLAQAVAEAHGRIDILVNAGHAALKWARIDDRPAADFAAAFQEVVLAALNGMKAVRAVMARARAGRIVNVGSIYGATANEGVTDAATMDGARAALTRSVGVEWAKDGVLVNFLQPALADIGAFADYRAGRAAAVSALVENTPLQRLADPVEDIGGAALFLVSDEACFIVGHKVFADGGQHLTAAAFEPGASR